MWLFSVPETIEKNFFLILSVSFPIFPSPMIMPSTFTIGYTVKERFVHREELYTADELFFVGTAAEVTPIVNVDGIIIGDGKIGKETDKIRKKFFSIVSGSENSHKKWLTLVK